MNHKKQWIWFVGAIVILGGALAWLLSQQNQTAKLSDAERFVVEYSEADTDHRFVYADNQEVLNTFSSGTGVVYLGFPECPWCQSIVPILDEAAKAEGVDKIYYLNVRQSRTDNDSTHQALMDRLSDYLNKDEDGNPRLYVPDITILKDGEIIGRFIQESAEDANTPAEYWTSERRDKALAELRQMMQKL